MSINAFTSPAVTNSTQYPKKPGSETNARNQFDTAFKTITNQLNSDVTNKLNSTTNGGGAAHIGCTNVATGSGSTVYDNIAFTYAAAVNAAVNSVPNDSLTEAKMATDMKKDTVAGVASTNAVTNIDSRHGVFAVGGSNTALTITTNAGYTYTQGRPIKFKANQTSTGTTINVDGLGAKPFLKSDGTTNATTTANKVYEAFYDTSNGGRFFVLARAEGNAVAGDVLAGKTFSNDDDTNIIGTLTFTGTATTSDVVNGKTFYATNTTPLTGTAKISTSGSLTVNSNIVTVTGLSFTPRYIIVEGGPYLGTVYSRRSYFYSPSYSTYNNTILLSDRNPVTNASNFTINSGSFSVDMQFLQNGDTAKWFASE